MLEFLKAAARYLRRVDVRILELAFSTQDPLARARGTRCAAVPA